MDRRRSPAARRYVSNWIKAVRQDALASHFPRSTACSGLGGRASFLVFNPELTLSSTPCENLFSAFMPMAPVEGHDAAPESVPAQPSPTTPLTNVLSSAYCMSVCIHTGKLCWTTLKLGAAGCADLCPAARPVPARHRRRAAGAGRPDADHAPGGGGAEGRPQHRAPRLRRAGAGGRDQAGARPRQLRRRRSAYGRSAPARAAQTETLARQILAMAAGQGVDPLDLAERISALAQSKERNTMNSYSRRRKPPGRVSVVRLHRPGRAGHGARPAQRRSTSPSPSCWRSSAC